MSKLPSRHRRLDDALADLPLEEPMLLSELDGFLTGVLLSPDEILPGEWLTSIWGTAEDGNPPFDDPADLQWFIDAVTARYNEIARDLARGKLHPIFEVDKRNGDVLWEVWLEGFVQAMDLRPEGWDALGDSHDPAVATAMVLLMLLISIANNTSPLNSVQINAMQPENPGNIIAVVLALHAARLRRADAAPAAVVAAPTVKVGRNDPCPCGSGKKFKRCCG